MTAPAVDTTSPTPGAGTPNAPETPVSRWVVWGALIAAGLAVAWPALADILRIVSKDEEASQVMLAPVVFAWLVAVRRERIGSLQLTGNPLGPALVLVGWALSWYGFYHARQSLWHLGSILVVVGCGVSVLETRVVKVLLPALLVLVFLIPVPNLLRQQIALPMQRVTASATEFVFVTLGMDVTRMGNVLSFKGQDVAVAEACNGMRMVFVLLLVSYAMAFAWPLRGYVKATILILSPVTAVVCNVIRLVPTVYLYGTYPDSTLPETFHDVSGWVMIGVAFVLVLGIIQLLRWLDLPVDREAAGPSPEEAPLAQA